MVCDRGARIDEITPRGNYSAVCDLDGVNPLMVAVSLGDKWLSISQWLVEQSVDSQQLLASRSKASETALDVAFILESDSVTSGWNDTIRWLMELSQQRSGTYEAIEQMLQEKNALVERHKQAQIEAEQRKLEEARRLRANPLYQVMQMDVGAANRREAEDCQVESRRGSGKRVRAQGRAVQRAQQEAWRASAEIKPRHRGAH